MTREDAFEIWLPIIKMGVKSMPECSEAIDMAIKALKQEPCTDAISRQAAIDACLNGWNKDYKEIVEDIRALPPVNPAEKVGQWIDDNKDEIDAQYGRHLYRCQICNKYAEYFVGGTEDWWDIEKPNYCPHCGAKMQEVTE